MQVVDTMKEVGINITFPVEEYTYRVAFLTKVYEDALQKYGYEIYEEKRNPKKGMKTLIRKM